LIYETVFWDCCHSWFI